MTKQEFLTKLNSSLSFLADKDRKEVLYDYEEHFRFGMAEGKAEAEIVHSLGDVKTIAKQFRADYSLKEAETNTSASNIFKAVLATAGLGFLNLVFVLGPFIGLVGVLIGLFGAAIGMTFGGLGSLIMVLLAPFFPHLIGVAPNYPLIIFLSIGLTATGLLFLIGNWYLVRLFFKGTVKYLKWNIEIIKNRGE